MTKSNKKILDLKPAKNPLYAIFHGKHVIVNKLDPSKDLDQLYLKTHGNVEREKVWAYLPYGPFISVDEMKQFYQKEMERPNKLVFVIYDKKTQMPIGLTALVDINPEMASIEIGSVLYCPEFQKTAANTETIYFLAKHCFEELGYRRIAWRCNNNNLASKKAAIRLGFEFEGIFYNHMIVKNENRDTAWFGLISDRWSYLVENYVSYLYNEKSSANASLFELNQKVPKLGKVAYSQD